MKGEEHMFAETRISNDLLHAEGNERNMQLTSTFMEEYVRTIEQRQKLKKTMFSVTISLLVMVITVLISVMVYSFSFVNQMVTIAITIGGLSVIVVALITLPTVIAKYLFDPEEQRHHAVLMEKILDLNRISFDQPPIDSSELISQFASLTKPQQEAVLKLLELRGGG